jgi:hypothetical protein
MIVFVLVSGTQTILVTYGLVDMPYLVMPAFRAANPGAGL